MIKRKIVVLGIILVLILGLVACNNEVYDTQDNGENTTIRMTISLTPNSVPFIYMAENDLLGENIKLDLSFHKNRQEAVAKVTKKDVDIVNLAVQEIAQLYNNDYDIKLLNVAAWGEYSLMTTTGSNKIEDMRGSEVWLSTRGGPIDLITTVVLEHNNLKKNTDVTFKFLNQRELSQMVISGIKNYEYFVLREPYISQAKLNNKEIKEVVHLGNEWEEILSYKFPQSGISVLGEFFNENQQIVNLFLDKYLESLVWVKENPEEAAGMAAPYMQGLTEDVILLALENFDTDIVSIEDSREAIEIYFNYILEFNPEMISNELPEDNFYIGE